MASLDLEKCSVLVKGVSKPFVAEELFDYVSKVASVDRVILLEDNRALVVLSNPKLVDRVCTKLSGAMWGKEPLIVSKLSEKQAEQLANVVEGNYEADGNESGHDECAPPAAAAKGEAVDSIIRAIEGLDSLSQKDLVAAISSRFQRQSLGGAQDQGQGEKATHISTPDRPRRRLTGRLGGSGADENGGSLGDFRVPNSGTTDGRGNFTMIEGQTTVIPKLSQFSGCAEPKQGETNFVQWRTEVRCLILDDAISDRVVMRAARRAVKGTAADVLSNLGEDSSPQQMLEKFEVVFGNVLTPEQWLAEFYAATQGEKEGVADWSCRIERIARRAQEKSTLPTAALEEMTRSKFWTGLHNPLVKSQTRHKFDDDENLNELVVACRGVEAELAVGVRKNATHVNQVSSDRNRDADHTLGEVLKEIKNVQARLQAVEGRVCGPTFSKGSDQGQRSSGGSHGVRTGVSPEPVNYWHGTAPQVQQVQWTPGPQSPVGHSGLTSGNPQPVLDRRQNVSLAPPAQSVYGWYHPTQNSAWFQQTMVPTVPTVVDQVAAANMWPENATVNTANNFGQIGPGSWSGQVSGFSTGEQGLPPAQGNMPTTERGVPVKGRRPGFQNFGSANPGTARRCFRCDSPNHFVRDCPLPARIQQADANLNWH